MSHKFLSPIESYQLYLFDVFVNFIVVNSLLTNTAIFLSIFFLFKLNVSDFLKYSIFYLEVWNIIGKCDVQRSLGGINEHIRMIENSQDIFGGVNGFIVYILIEWRLPFIYGSSRVCQGSCECSFCAPS